MWVCFGTNLVRNFQLVILLNIYWKTDKRLSCEAVRNLLNVEGSSAVSDKAASTDMFREIPTSIFLVICSSLVSVFQGRQTPKFARLFLVPGCKVFTW